MRKKILIDLCCGRGGWSKGFIARGWHAIGYDLNPQPDYPGEFRQRDLFTMTAADLIEADFIVCSTSCEQFSVFGMKHFHPNPPYPQIGIDLFEHARTLCKASGKPYVMENVRSAQRFVGPAVNHCGPFYLWGNAVPAIMPREVFELRKGMSQQRDRGADGKRIYAAAADRMWSTKRKAIVAEIPFELAECVANLAGVV